MPTPKAQYQLTKLIKDLDEGKFKYKPKDKKPIEWFFYTEAQVNELNDYINLVRNLVNEVEEREGNIEEYRRGRPPKSPYDKSKAVLLQQFFQVSNRTAEGLVKLFDKKLGIRDRLSYKDIERAYNNPDVRAIIISVFRLSNEPIRHKENKFSIDGSGEPTSIKQNYTNDREDDKKKAVYDMLIGMVGTTYKMFSAFAVTGPGGESSLLVPLLDETSEMFNNIELVCGDKGYLSRDNCTAIAKLGAKPRIHPKSNTRINARGSFAWKRMMLDFIKDAQGWLRDCHNRSISESVFSSGKRRFTRPLLKKMDDRREAELGFRVCAYNIRRLAYISYLPEIHVKWL